MKGVACGLVYLEVRGPFCFLMGGRNTLTAMQLKFCEHWAVHRNGTAAMVAAGGSKKSAAVQASKWLKLPKIRARIEELIENALLEAGGTEKDLLQAVAESALADHSVAYQDDGTPKRLRDIPRHVRRQIKRVISERVSVGRGKNRRTVTRVTGYEFIDQQESRRLLGMNKNLWKDGGGASGPISITVNTGLEGAPGSERVA